MTSDIEPTARILESRLGSVVNRADIEAVLAALLELRREFAFDRLRFEDKHSGGSRMHFDRRLLLFLADEPAPNARRFVDGHLGGRMT